VNRVICEVEKSWAWRVSLEHATTKEARSSFTKCITDRQKPALVHTPKQFNVSRVKAVGFQNCKDGSMIYSVKRIFDVQKKNYRLTFILALLCQDTMELGQLTPRAAMPAKSLLRIIEQLIVLYYTVKTTSEDGREDKEFRTFACNRPLLRHP
jgi:hypothetical protein